MFNVPGISQVYNCLRNTTMFEVEAWIPWIATDISIQVKGVEWHQHHWTISRDLAQFGDEWDGMDEIAIKIPFLGWDEPQDFLADLD